MTDALDRSTLAARNGNPPGIGLVDLIREDLRTHGGQWRRAGFRTVLLHRLGNARLDLPGPFRKMASIAYRTLEVRYVHRYGIELPYTVRLGRRVVFAHQGGTVVNGWCVIDDDVVIRHGVTVGVRSDAEVDAVPRIGARVEIGAGAAILGGILVGDDSRIGANAVVVRDVPAAATVGGVPAVPLRGAREAL